MATRSAGEKGQLPFGHGAANTPYVIECKGNEGNVERREMSYEARLAELGWEVRRDELGYYAWLEGVTPSSNGRYATIEEAAKAELEAWKRGEDEYLADEWERERAQKEADRRAGKRPPKMSSAEAWAILEKVERDDYYGHDLAMDDYLDAYEAERPEREAREKAEAEAERRRLAREARAERFWGFGFKAVGIAILAFVIGPMLASTGLRGLLIFGFFSVSYLLWRILQRLERQDREE
jgi:hypothetical protein